MAAPSNGDSALLLWNDYPGNDEQAFNDWYDRRHIPERVPGLPGFLRARRFAALSGGPKYIALYDLDSAGALKTPQYRALLDNLDAETRHFVSRFERTSKTALSDWATAGHDDGQFLAAFGFDTDVPLPSREACREHVAGLAPRGDIVAAHVMRRDADAMAGATPTRPGDLALSWVLLVEAVSEKALAGLEPGSLLARSGNRPEPRREGVFRLIFASHR